MNDFDDKGQKQEKVYSDFLIGGFTKTNVLNVKKDWEWKCFPLCSLNNLIHHHLIKNTSLETKLDTQNINRHSHCLNMCDPKESDVKN